MQTEINNKITNEQKDQAIRYRLDIDIRNSAIV